MDDREEGNYNTPNINVIFKRCFINILCACVAKSSFNREQGNYSSHKNNCRAK